MTDADSCTTNNTGQEVSLRKPLTTGKGRIGILRDMPAKAQKRPVEAIYQSRQPRRPHYLAKLMDRHSVTRNDIIERTGVDKSLLSRWLDEDRPSTPSPKWAKKLGELFRVAPDDDPVDIFADPDVDWLVRTLRGRSGEEIARIRAMIEAAFPSKRAS